MPSTRKKPTRKSMAGKRPKKGHLPVEEILRRLGPLYGPAESPRPYDPISELIFTVLSQHTSDVNSYRANETMRERFPTWEALMEADIEELAGAIQIGGLAKVKAPRIQAILRAILERNEGSWDLSFLSEMPLADAKEWLLELPGVGPKTAGCVLLFSLGRPAMVVDTHVYRVSQRLGLIGPKANADEAHDLLEENDPRRRRVGGPRLHHHPRSAGLQSPESAVYRVHSGGRLPIEHTEEQEETP